MASQFSAFFFLQPRPALLFAHQLVQPLQRGSERCDPAGQARPDQLWYAFRNRRGQRSTVLQLLRGEQIAREAVVAGGELLPDDRNPGTLRWSLRLPSADPSYSAMASSQARRCAGLKRFRFSLFMMSPVFFMA
jgi:hypothetical protein